MKLLEEKTLDEILLMNNKTEIEQYHQELKNLSTNRLNKRIVDNLYGESIEYIWSKIFQEEEQIRSILFFPDDLVLMYPNKKEMHTKNFITCDFSGALIYPGSLYINYRPFIENITNNERYVLKRTLKVEPAYESELPTTIKELELLQQNIWLEIEDSSGINYSHLGQSIGGDLILQKLQRRK